MSLKQQYEGLLPNPDDVLSEDSFDGRPQVGADYLALRMDEIPEGVQILTTIETDSVTYFTVSASEYHLATANQPELAEA